jgi:hypothetical protein
MKELSAFERINLLKRCDIGSRMTHFGLPRVNYSNMRVWGSHDRFHPFLQATKALRESRGIASLCFQTLALEGGEESASRPGRLLPPGKTRYPLYRRLGGAPGPFWTGAENLAPTGIRSLDRSARSQSLYRLSYPSHVLTIAIMNITVLADFTPFSIVVVRCFGRCCPSITSLWNVLIFYLTGWDSEYWNRPILNKKRRLALLGLPAEWLLACHIFPWSYFSA